MPSRNQHQIIRVALVYDTLELRREQHLAAILGFSHVQRFDANLVSACQHISCLCDKHKPEHPDELGADVDANLLISVDDHFRVTQGDKILSQRLPHMLALLVT